MADEQQTSRLRPSHIIASSLAALTGAFLASRLGVYGTVIGVGVISFFSGHTVPPGGDSPGAEIPADPMTPSPTPTESPTPEPTAPPVDGDEGSSSGSNDSRT
jgi:hypothetical protein